jgi:hypothetical protein
VNPSGALHAYLAGSGRDGRGRTIEDVLAFHDDQLEAVHDFVQWLFPLRARSGAQPNAPVLTQDEVDAIRGDPQAIANLRRGAERMLRFYRETGGWLTRDDHNHLRISRIIASLAILAGADAARAFHDAIMARHAAEGSPVNPRNLAYWSNALAAA